MSSGTRRILIYIAAIGVAVAGYGSVRAAEQQPAVPVTTFVAEKHPIEQTVDLTGSVTASKTVTVYSEVTGVIEKLLVERGMKVGRGDVIAVVEHKAETAQRKGLVAAVEAAKVGIRQAEAAVEVARATLEQAEAQLENATLEKDRIENLYKQSSTSKQKFDTVTAQYKVAVAGRDLAAANLRAAQESVARAEVGLTQAQVALEQMDIRIADYTIRAPIGGVVSRRFVDEGAMDNPALPIVEIMDTSVLKVNCDVAQVDAGKVREGQPAELTTDTYPGYTFEGTVKIVNPALDPGTRTMPVEIRAGPTPVSGETGDTVRLKPGMFVKLSIATGEKTVLAVPRDCLMRLPGTGVYYLFVVKDGTAEKRTVEVGISRGNLVEILSGLKEGDRVVVKGQVNLRAGTPVRETM